MMKFLRYFLVAALLLAGGVGAIARTAVADINSGSGTNVQDGDNDSSTDQEGSANSGDAVAGQVTGVVSSGDASVDATNRSEDVDIETGDAEGNNDAATFTGLNYGGSTTSVSAEDITITSGAGNILEGDNESDLSQTADASSGDGVGGQVIGVVTAAGGSADVVAANTSEDVDVETGDAEANNDAAAFVGLNFSSDNGAALSVAADISSGSGGNVQEGDNDLNGDQTATASTGDGVGGQVLGVVSAGDASLDATNRSEDVDVQTGDSEANNDAAAFVGLNYAGSQTNVSAEDINLASSSVNLQEGDNEGSFDQTADATSGDGVAGQVAGVVTSAGGSADLVLSNTSVDSDAETGDGEFNNADSLFVGLNFASNNETFIG